MSEYADEAPLDTEKHFPLVNRNRQVQTKENCHNDRVGKEQSEHNDFVLTLQTPSVHDYRDLSNYVDTPSIHPFTH